MYQVIKQSEAKYQVPNMKQCAAQTRIKQYVMQLSSTRQCTR